MAENFKKVKKYLKGETEDSLLSQWASSQTIEMDNGETLQIKINSIDKDISDEIARAKKAESNLDEKKIDKTTVAKNSSLGLVKSGTDITVDEEGNVNVNDNSHQHLVSNISDLSTTAEELNTLDGIVTTTEELNKLHGSTVTTEDLNKLHDISVSALELNYTSGVKDNIQGQLDKKAPLASPTFTGVPKAPTASTGTNTTQIATTAFTQTAVSNHNISTTAHTDIRDLISGLTIRLNALADSDDTTLDQLSEIVAYIKSNRTLIESITTSKVNVSDIIDTLSSTATNKPLSANQGKVLNDLITTLTSVVDTKIDTINGDTYIGSSKTGTTATITHKDVKRTNTTSAIAPTPGNTFTAIKSITSDSKGHITGVNTETVTLPSTSISVTAKDVSYDNTDSQLSSSTVQGAVDEIASTFTEGYWTYATSAVGGTAGRVTGIKFNSPIYSQRLCTADLSIQNKSIYANVENELLGKEHSEVLSFDDYGVGNFPFGIMENGISLSLKYQAKGSYATSTHTHNYAGSSTAGGSATSAVKLDSSAGSATQPVYFSSGKPVACTYTLGKSVPSNAVFTDTTYSKMTAATADAAGAAGLVPAPAAGAQAKFLRGDGKWATPTNTTYSTFVKSGSDAAAGLVPKPPTTEGTTKYLREDGKWVNPVSGYLPLTGGDLTGNLTTTKNILIGDRKDGTGNTGINLSPNGIMHLSRKASEGRPYISLFYDNATDATSQWMGIGASCSYFTNYVNFGDSTAQTTHRIKANGSIYASGNIYEGGTALSSKYLSLSGGTMTGNLVITAATGTDSGSFITSKSKIFCMVSQASGGYTCIGGKAGAHVVDNNNDAFTEIQASAFTKSSSIKVKENIIPITVDETKKILDVEVVSFDYKEKFGGTKGEVGVIAEWTQSIIPNAVTVPENYSEDTFDEAKGINQPILGVDYTKFVPYLIKMVQMQQEEIEQLKATIR